MNDYDEKEQRRREIDQIKNEGKAELNFNNVYNYIAHTITLLEMYKEANPCREYALALTKLEESLMWFNKGFEDN